MNRIVNDNLNPDSDKETSEDSINLEKEKALELEKYYPPVSLAKSFEHALYGIKETWACERNFKIHSICATAAIALALIVGLDTYNWLALILVISSVLTTEIINTAIEHLVDLAADSLYHPLAKAAKDAAAGAVLITSISAVICGLIIFCPRLLPIGQQLLKLMQH